jgi:predicted DNA-binding WGR domain protein
MVAKMEERNMKRYFIFKDDTSQKFWNIKLVLNPDYEDSKYDEYYIITQYGAIGTKGEENEQEFETSEEAEKEFASLISQKIKEGYKETKEVDLYFLTGVSIGTQADKDDLTNNKIKEAEDELGFKIPESYLKLLRIKNGDETWRPIGTHLLEMTGFSSLEGLVENTYDALWANDAPYPDIGIFFADTESGHEKLVLNYKDIVVEGEPSVWHLDEESENGFMIAKTFDEFIRQIYFEDFTAVDSIKDENFKSFHKEWAEYTRTAEEEVDTDDSYSIKRYRELWQQSRINK